MMTPMSDGKRKIMLAITQSNYGGAQRYVYDLATSLAKDEYDVVVVAGGKGVLVEQLQRAGIRTISLESLIRHVDISADFRTFFAFIKLLRREKPDILHTNSSKIGGIGALAGRIARVRHIVFTAHAWEFNAPRPSLQKFFIKILAKLTVRLSHTTIAVSEKVCQQVGRGLRKKIVIIHNGIPDIAFSTREEARAAFRQYTDSPGADEFWIGTVAELHPVKGLAYGIEAFKKFYKEHGPARYLIVGSGSEKEHLQRDIRRNDLTNRIHLTGFIPDAATLLKAFDVFLLPSISEGLNYAILEAGAAGLPVIASDTGGISEIVSQKNGILTPVGDTRAISDALTFLYVNPQARERLGSALSARVREKFSLQAMIKKTAAVYSR